VCVLLNILLFDCLYFVISIKLSPSMYCNSRSDEQFVQIHLILTKKIPDDVQTNT